MGGTPPKKTCGFDNIWVIQNLLKHMCENHMSLKVPVHELHIQKGAEMEVPMRLIIYL